MEIINAHVHMIEMQKMVQMHGDISLPPGIAVLEHIQDTLPLLSPQTLLAQMDEAGIDKSILYAVQAPIVYASNEYVCSLVSEHPDRLLGFASVNPHDPQAPAVLETAVKEMGLKGLKLHPPLQNFYPDDKAVFPIYEKAVELDIPVVFHVGTTPFGSMCRLDQANPLLIDAIAVAFPSLRILLTHLGTLWHNESFMVVEKNPNVFIDTAAYITEIPQILTSDIVRRIGPDKIIFGTDYPMPYGSHGHRMKDFVDCIKSLPLQDDVIKAIMGQNINRLLHGPDSPAQGVSLKMLMAQMQEMLGK
ncbi:MAG TPA: amidohydrolase [Phycisphaerae bacterium]|nr:amidohydrolase [Phycisphaerae bacterium]